MSNSFRKIAIIPLYNEIGKIGKVLAKFVSPTVDEICLVVDCPSETLLREIEVAGREIDIPINIIKNFQRKGIGYAIREGIQYALGKGYDIVVVMAGNDKDDPREIPRLLGYLLPNLVCLVLVALGSYTLVWVGWLTWYDITWSKSLALIFLGPRTGEAISLGINMKVIHYLFIGLALFLSGIFTFFRKRLRKV